MLTFFTESSKTPKPTPPNMNVPAETEPARIGQVMKAGRRNGRCSQRERNDRQRKYKMRMKRRALTAPQRKAEQAKLKKQWQANLAAEPVRPQTSSYTYRSNW